MVIEQPQVNTGELHISPVISKLFELVLMIILEKFVYSLVLSYILAVVMHRLH